MAGWMIKFEQDRKKTEKKDSKKMLIKGYSDEEVSEIMELSLDVVQRLLTT